MPRSASPSQLKSSSVRVGKPLCWGLGLRAFQPHTHAGVGYGVEGFGIRLENNNEKGSGVRPRARERERGELFLCDRLPAPGFEDGSVSGFGFRGLGFLDSGFGIRVSGVGITCSEKGSNLRLIDVCSTQL